MLSHFLGRDSYLVMAFERQKSLIEEAQKQRACHLAAKMGLEQPLRRRKWFRQLRNRTGDLLVYCGQRLKAEATHTI